MMHPRFSRIRRFKNGELDARSRRRMADHLAGCPRCQDRLRSVDRVRDRIREATRLEPPAGLWERIEASRRQGAEVILPGAEDERRSRRGPLRASWAAILILAFAGLGTAAVVAAPGGAWLRPLQELFAPAVEAPETAGVQVPVSGSSVVVALEEPAGALEVHIGWRRGSELGVRATGPAARAVFRPTSDGVRVIGAGAGELDVTLPGGVTRAELTVDGTLRWIYENGRARTLPGSTGSPEIRIESGGGER